jgi:hypothetical protein
MEKESSFMNKINVIIYGCGVMGRKIAQALLTKKSFKIIGAVDIHPGLVGKDLGEFLKPCRRLGIIITKDAARLLAKPQLQAVIHTTTSGLKDVSPQVVECLKAGKNVISTCEELSYPWKRHPRLASEIDALAKKHKATVTGTGINPGFLMDTLPLVLTGPCLEVRSIKVRRMMNSARRRIPFQKKVGTGMTPREFRQKIDSKEITGHVGLLESINMIASALGWTYDKAIELPPKPVIAKKPTQSGLGTVKPGWVIGLISRAYARRNGKDIITLEFCAHAGIRDEYDEILIDGTPPIHERIQGGVHGDIGTVAMTINTIPKAVESLPGLKVMRELPPVVATL